MKIGTRAHVLVCMGSSCFARGNRENLAVLEQFLARHALECQVELRGSRCENTCCDGPVIVLNGKAHHEVDSESLIDLLNAELLPGREE